MKTRSLFAAAAAIAALFAQSCAQPCYEVRTDVPNKAFYKDIFMDTGIRMMEYRSMPVVDYLGLEYEYFFAPENTPENQALQNAAYCGCETDLNGVLLYPDGEPRFRIIYVNGGYAGSHSLSLMARGRNNFRQAVMNGGSFIGSCAGAFLASYGTYGSRRAQNGYLGLWPGVVDNTAGIMYPDYKLPEGSPLLQYYDFGGNSCVEGVMHMNGPYFSRWADTPGTEVLAVNDYPEYKFNGYPSIIAYKEDGFTGRVIPSGGHPEQVPDGEGRDLMAALVKYAFDGLGAARVKSVLVNGEALEPDRIGDGQCHHFVFALPENATDVKVTLEALDSCNLSLRLANGTFAFKEDAQYSVENGETAKELKFDSLEEGLWYVGVQCEDRVECTFGEHGFEYGGNLALLNGMRYSIRVSWNQKGRKSPKVILPERDFPAGALLSPGSDFCEYLKQLSDPLAKASSADTSITRIVFRTSDSSCEGVRVDDLRSSEPIYAALNEGVVTVSTPAKSITAGVDASFMFAHMHRLKEVENIQVLNTSGTKYFNDMFNECVALECFDITALDMGSAWSTVNMFVDCKMLKDFNGGRQQDAEAISFQ